MIIQIVPDVATKVSSQVSSLGPPLPARRSRNLRRAYKSRSFADFCPQRVARLDRISLSCSSTQSLRSLCSRYVDVVLVVWRLSHHRSSC